MEATKISKKQQFLENPNIDPYTGEIIKINGKEYKKYVDKWDEPNKIKSPLTGNLICVGKGERKKLNKAGFTQEELLSGNLKIVEIENKYKKYQ